MCLDVVPRVVHVLKLVGLRIECYCCDGIVGSCFQVSQVCIVDFWRRNSFRFWNLLDYGHVGAVVFLLF
jgi:hypothetical protein